jgi:hypothetical protein
VVHRLSSDAGVLHRCSLIVAVEVVVELRRGCMILRYFCDIDLEFFFFIFGVFRLLVHLMEISDEVVISC